MSDTNGNHTEIELISDQTDSGSGFMNTLLGIGSTAYDPTTANQIDTSLDLLTEEEITALYDRSNIVKAIINVYPNDSAFGFPSINSSYGNYGVKGEQLIEYLDEKLIDSRSLSLEEAFRIASKKARKWGVHYLVMGINDGRLPTDPIDENNIQSFDFIMLKNHRELIPDDYKNPSYFEFDYSLAYDQYVGKNGVIRIHPDRVLSFYGQEKSDGFERATEPISALQAVLDAVLTRTLGLKQGGQLLTKKAILWAVLNPPPTIVNPASKFMALNERLRGINLQASSHRMIGMNSGETLGALQLDLNGVDKLFEANDNELLAQTNLVRYKLFGESAQSGLSQSSAGVEQKSDHASRCTTWSKSNWAQHLDRIYHLVCLSKDSPTSGRKLRGLSVNLTTYPNLDPVEWATLREQNSKWALTFEAAGIISKAEVRQAFFNSSDIERQLVPNIQLDDAFTKKLEDEALNPPQPIAPILPQVQKDESDKIEISKPDFSKLDNFLDKISEVSLEDIDRTLDEV